MGDWDIMGTTFATTGSNEPDYSNMSQYNNGINYLQIYGIADPEKAAVNNNGTPAIGTKNYNTTSNIPYTPYIYENDVWNANVGKGSTVTGGTRSGGSIYGGGGGTNKNTTTGGYGGYSSNYNLGNYEAYTPSAVPTMKSTYIAPDENKIQSLTMSGGGNSLRATVANLINRNLASSAALPLAVRNAQLRNISENIAEAYSKSMPNIRKTAANEWNTLYGAPQQHAAELENQYAMQAWLNTERARQAEYEARLKSALPVPVAGGGYAYSGGSGGGGGYSNTNANTNSGASGYPIYYGG